MVTLSVPTHSDPLSHCCSTRQQFLKSSSAMLTTHPVPCTQLTHQAARYVQSTAVCVAFCRFATAGLLTAEPRNSQFTPRSVFLNSCSAPSPIYPVAVQFFLPTVCLCNCPCDVTGYAVGLYRITQSHCPV